MCNVTPNLNITWKISLTTAPAAAYFVIIAITAGFYKDLYLALQENLWVEIQHNRVDQDN